MIGLAVWIAAFVRQTTPEMPCFDFIAWSDVWCTMGGPGLPSPNWDLTGDGSFDLRDFAIHQNSAKANTLGVIGHDEPCRGVCE